MKAVGFVGGDGEHLVEMRNGVSCQVGRSVGR